MSFLPLPDVKLHYQVLGQGDPAVVFLHGLVMDNLSSWFFTMANAVAQHRQVLLYDLRGHGFSDRPREGYGVARHVADLRGLLDGAGLARPVILVGNSFGGLLAVNFARAFPERVRGLILVDAQLNDDTWGGMMKRSLGLEGGERDAMIEKNFQSWQGRNSRRKSNRLAESAGDLVQKTSLIADLGASPVITDADLRAIASPTLAIYGADSDMIGVGQRLGATLPRCRLEVLAGCTHSVLWEKTDEVRALILDGIAEIARPQEAPAGGPTWRASSS